MNTNNLNGQGIPQNGQHSLEGPLFSVHSIYLKDISFEAPHVPQIFQQAWKPKVDFDLQMGSQVLSEFESIYEVVLHLTVTVKLGEEEQAQTAFVIDLQQAGAFSAKAFSEEDLRHLLATTCPALLFPYAGETVSNMATRGGFPQLVLPPINFDRMYAQHVSGQAESPQGARA
jgi:preprotein translocase subunit SecB